MAPAKAHAQQHDTYACTCAARQSSAPAKYAKNIHARTKPTMSQPACSLACIRNLCAKAASYVNTESDIAKDKHTSTTPATDATHSKEMPKGPVLHHHLHSRCTPPCNHLISCAGQLQCMWRHTTPVSTPHNLPWGRRSTFGHQTGLQRPLLTTWQAILAMLHRSPRETSNRMPRAFADIDMPMQVHAESAPIASTPPTPTPPNAISTASNANLHKCRHTP